jgi:hypothetical protein
MGQWQCKFLFSAVLYAAGFLTAVYFLAPDPALASDQSQSAKSVSHLQPTQAADARIGSKVWISKIRAGIDTTINFAEEQSIRVAELIRAKMAQTSNPGSQTAVE